VAALHRQLGFLIELVALLTGGACPFSISGTMCSARHTSASLGRRLLDDHQFVSIGQRLVHFDPQHAGDAALVAQVHEHKSIVADFADDRRFPRQTICCQYTIMYNFITQKI
jgi:hypothetical protein